MAKKVGIITMQGNNFGNRLQSYAVQEILRQNGFITITYKREYYYKKENRKKIIMAYLVKWMSPLYNSRLISFQIKKILSAALRIYHMLSFTKQNIIMGGYAEKISSEEIRTNDYFVCGSDQIWNPYFPMVTQEDFLSFSPREKNVSIAASLGVDELLPEQKKIYQKYMMNIKGISVREERAKQILSEFTNQEIVVLADPTMVISKDKWIGIEKKVKTPPHYIVVYCLSQETKSIVKKMLDKIYGKESPEIIWLFDKNHPESFWYGPSEFIYVIHNADAVYTDSFHGTVFSLIFEKKVRVFERISNGFSMHSRIETLVQKMGLDSKIVIKDVNEAETECFIDYSTVNKRLVEEKEKYQRYINEYIK